MEYPGFKLFPQPGRAVDSDEQRTIEAILERWQVVKQLPPAPEILVEVGRKISPGAALSEAHGEWNETFIRQIKTPGALPRQLNDAVTTDGLVHVTVSVINKHTGGMGSHFGFEGYFLSLLVSPSAGSIWDARGESAQ